MLALERMDLELVEFRVLGRRWFSLTADEYDWVKIGWIGPRKRRAVRRIDYTNDPATGFWIRDGKVIPKESPENYRLWEMAVVALQERLLDNYITKSERIRGGGVGFSGAVKRK